MKITQFIFRKVFLKEAFQLLKRAIERKGSRGKNLKLLLALFFPRVVFLSHISLDETKEMWCPARHERF